MSTYDIYFNQAINHAYEMLEHFNEIEPSFKNLLNLPSRDDTLLHGLETPVFRSMGGESTLITIRVWIQSIHLEAWSDNIEQSLRRRLYNQSDADMFSFEIMVLVYYT